MDTPSFTQHSQDSGMNETTTTTTLPPTTITQENAREMFQRAVWEVANNHGRTVQRNILREFLQNNIQFRDAFADCLDDFNVIRAFVYASHGDDVELLQAFFDVGMNVDAKTQFGVNALNDASYYGRKKSLGWLLDHNADVNSQDNEGGTPLIYASLKRKTKTAKILLEKNANVDIQRKDGQTALMLATLNGHHKMTRLLLHHGANIDLADKDGKTALDLAKDEEIKEIFRIHMTSYVLK